MRTSFGLAIQLLQPRGQILTLAYVVGIRNADGWFTAHDIESLCQDLRLPNLSSVNRLLGQLRSSRLAVTRRAGQDWSLTPLGVENARDLLTEFDYGLIDHELLVTPGADFANVRHTVIPPAFAPAKWQTGIGNLLERYPFESNVFCMTRFPHQADSELSDPLQEVIDEIRRATYLHGLTLHLASDRIIEEDLWGNVVAHLWACQFGIGLLESREGDDGLLNSNMLIELGSMLTMGRRCAIIRDKSAAKPPTDLSGHIYKSVDFNSSETVSSAIHLWVSEDLGLGRCSACPPEVSDNLTKG